MYLEKFKILESKWKSEINDSALIITHHLCELMDKSEMLKKWLLILVFGTLFVVSVFSIPNSLDIRTWFDTHTDMFMIIAVAVGTVLLVNSSKKAQLYKEKIKKARDLLINRINADFCSCNKSCNHKEEFLADILRICNINLYYDDV